MQGAAEKRELEMRIEEMEEKEQVLQARIEALQADNDFTNERLAALQGTDTQPLYRFITLPFSVLQKYSHPSEVVMLQPQT